MLSFSQGEVWADTSVHQFFKHFGGRTQDGDRSVGGALIFGFSRFEDREDDGVFPYCWEVGMLVGEVEEFGEVTDSPWAQVF